MFDEGGCSWYGTTLLFMLYGFPIRDLSPSSWEARSFCSVEVASPPFFSVYNSELCIYVCKAERDRTFFGGTGWDGMSDSVLQYIYV